MTAKELSRLRWLCVEIPLEKKRLAMEESTAVKELISQKLQESIWEVDRLTRFIYSVEDPYFREILVLRFLDGLTWKNVAGKMGNVTPESVKKACQRFLSKN